MCDVMGVVSPNGCGFSILYEVETENLQLHVNSFSFTFYAVVLYALHASLYIIWSG